ncbi:MAG: ABC transporter substrate-binding protein [Streptosporangiaceae bacterium]
MTKISPYPPSAVRRPERGYRPRRATRALALVGAALAGAGLLAACDGSSSSSSSGSSSAVVSAATIPSSTVVPGASAATGYGSTATTATPVQGGVLHFGVLDAPQVIDPHEASSYPESIIADNITDKLTWQDPVSGKLYPWLATSWSYNSSLTRFTFQLRHGVTFSNGQPFNAAAVQANFDQDAWGDAKLQILPDPTHWTGYIGTLTPNPYEVIVEFSKPNAGFLTFSSFSGDNDPGFVADKTLESSKTQRLTPANVIGTGPFIVKSFTYEQNVILVRRAGYDWAPAPLAHNGAAYLNEIDIETIPEASVRTGALEAGQLQATLDVAPTDETSLKAAGYQILYQPIGGQNIAFQLNADLFPTNDLDVRKAINLGWNRAALFGPVLSSSYRAAWSVLAPNVPGYVSFENSALRYDPAAAEALLNSDGWKVGNGGYRYKDGQELTVKFLGINNLAPNQSAYELIQEQLKQVGINVELSVLPIPDFESQEDVAQTKWNGVAANTSRDDPSVLWQADSPAVGNGSYVQSSSSEYQPLVNVLQQVQSTLDPAERAAATAQAQNLLIAQYALVDPVYVPSQVIAADQDVHGIVFDAQSRNLFYGTWIGK